MNFEENLINYTAYSNGDLEKKCNLQYEDETIISFDFSKYDLNNSYFGGVTFEKCVFSNVYLSGSNFGGSFLKDCILENNDNRKSIWDDIMIDNSKISEMDAFKSSFMYGKFHNIQFVRCNFEFNNFDGSEFMNVSFIDCNVNCVDFSECKFSNVIFSGCKLENVKFDDNNKPIINAVLL